MGIVKEYYPQCDECEYANPDLRSITIKECRSGMNRNGWIKKDKSDICPDCVTLLESKGIT